MQKQIYGWFHEASIFPKQKNGLQKYFILACLALFYLCFRIYYRFVDFFFAKIKLITVFF